MTKKEYEKNKVQEYLRSIVKGIIEEEKNEKKNEGLCYECVKKLKKDNAIFSVEIYTVSRHGNTFSSTILLDSKDLKEAIIRKLNRQYAEDEPA